MTSALDRATDALDRVSSRPTSIDFAAAGRGVQDAADRSVVVEWVQRLAVVHQGVDLLLDSPLIPAAYWPLPRVNGVNKLKDWPHPWLRHPQEAPEDYIARRRITGATAAATALWGEKYGWTPEVSWGRLYVTNGKVGMQYEGILSRLQEQGWRIDWQERSATRAALRLLRPGSSEWTQVYEFTMADAERAGYVKGKGPNVGSDAWKGNAQYDLRPKIMLAARAVGEASRFEAADALAGVIVAELAHDDDYEEPDRPARTPVGVTVVDGVPPSAGNAGRSLTALVQQASAEREAALDVREATPTHAAGDAVITEVEGLPQPDPTPPAEGGANVTRPQLSQISMLLGGRHGLGGPGSVAKRGRILSALVGRPLKTTQELTADEAVTVIGYLENTDTPALLAMADAPPADPEPTGTGADPWDEPAERDGSDE